MHGTWKQFKDTVEHLGVTDDDSLERIDVSNFDPLCIRVQQMNDTDPDFNIYTITSSDEVETP